MTVFQSFTTCSQISVICMKFGSPLKSPDMRKDFHHDINNSK